MDVKKIYAKFLFLLKNWKLEEIDKIILDLKRIENPNFWLNIFIKDLERKRVLINNYILNNDSIYLYIINECDYSCCFCDRSTKNFKNTTINATTLEDIKFIMYLNKWKKFDYIELWWHEPLANPHIYEIFNYLSQIVNSFKLNTSWSRPKELKNLVDAYDFINITIPLYSQDSNINDKITWYSWSKENYDYIVKLIESKKINYKINSVLTRHNKDDIELFTNPKIWFTLLFPNNYDVEKLYSENWLSFKEYKDFFLKMLDYDNDYSKIRLNFLFTSKWNLVSLPLCVLYGVSQDLYNTNIYNIELEKTLHKSEMNDVQSESRKCIKPKKCKTCKLYNNCHWYYKVHFDVFWEEEVSPVV